MQKLTIDFIRFALNSNLIQKEKLHSESDKEPFFSGMAIHSSQVRPGNLFIALGKGHAFIEEAISQGATGVVCEEGSFKSLESKKYIQFFCVKDSQTAFSCLVTAWRKAFRNPVIAIGGSAGKTTLKEFLAAILGGKWTSLLKTQGSQNGFDGIPFTLMQLHSEYQAAVIEIGIDEIGAMKKHMAMVAPTLAILSSIGPEHLEKLKDLPTVAQEEIQMLSLCSLSGGLIILNMNDPWIRDLSAMLPHHQKFFFTLKEEKELEQVFPKNEKEFFGFLDQKGSTLIVRRMKKESEISTFPLLMPLLGKHNASNLLGAVSVAFTLGLTEIEIQKGLALFEPAEGRSIIKELGTKKKVKVICDYYNAQPLSMKAGLELLSEVSKNTPEKHKTWACLADMLELGLEKEKFHRQLAPLLCALKINHVLLYGEAMKALKNELDILKKSAIFIGNCLHMDQKKDLNQFLHENIHPGDWVLIKGSNSMHMKTVFEDLALFIGN